MHWDRAGENIREQLGCTVQQLAHHYKNCPDVGGCVIVDTAGEQLDGEPADSSVPSYGRSLPSASKAGMT